jgi:hypothetical protein
MTDRNGTHAITRLSPVALHRLLRRRGLEQSGHLLVQATREQLAQLCDLDLWRAGQPGGDEELDAERFGDWLCVLADTGEADGSATLARLDPQLLVTALSRHVRVFDSAAVAPYMTLDGTEVRSACGARDDGVSCDIGGYTMTALRADAWDAIVALLNELAVTQPDDFAVVMNECVRLSSSRPEGDGLDDLLAVDEQASFDAAVTREQRRARLGYVTAADARAFLQVARHIDLRRDAPPAGSDQGPAHHRVPKSNKPGALVRGDHSSDPDEVLAWLANVLLAGASIQSRSLTPAEAAKAAASICALGLENWPGHWTPAGTARAALLRHAPVALFQVGWTILHEEVVMVTAEGLLAALASLRCDDLTQAAIDDLRLALTRHWRAGVPWLARDAMDAIAMLDVTTWTALTALIDELPTCHAALTASLDKATRPVNATDFEFIADNSRIRTVHAFVRALPEMLGGPSK